MKAGVRANGVLVRQSNSNMSPVIGSVSSGAVLDIEAEYGEWVKLTDGGWVKACYTEAVEVSGGASSWNDLEDKPFGEGETVEVVDLEEQETTTGSNYWSADYWPEFIKPVAGLTYVVTIDGVEYACVATDEEYPVLGNSAWLDEGGELSDPPFVYVNQEMAIAPAGTHTFKIAHFETEVKRLDGNFLPWLKITYDGENYAANMTYEEAAALLGSKSLLGGCYIASTGTVDQMSVIEDFRQGEEAYIHCITSGKQYCIYADGFVTEVSGDK